MRTIITAAASVIAVTALAPSAAQAKDYAKRASCSTKLERKYQARYKEVRQRHGTRAPGRNIGDHGVVRRNQTVRDARCREVAQSARQLRTLLTVPKPQRSIPTAVVKAVEPAQMPSGVQTASVQSNGGSSNPMVNPACESGGNPQVYDPSGTYWGKYQFDRQTWAAHGGDPGSYGSASELEQDRVAANVKYDAWPNC